MTLYDASDEIGRLIQRICKRPADANAALMITLGRLIAREGFDDVTSEKAWETTVIEQKALFEEGFFIERDHHPGRPR